MLPLERWCREPLREQLDQTFGDAELCRGVGLEAGSVDRLWRAFQKEPGLCWSRVWALFVLLWWAKRYDVRRLP